MPGWSVTGRARDGRGRGDARRPPARASRPGRDRRRARAPAVPPRPHVQDAVRDRRRVLRRRAAWCCAPCRCAPGRVSPVVLARRVRDRGGSRRVRTLAPQPGRQGRAPRSDRPRRAGSLVLVAYADRQPRRSLAARGRGAPRRGRDRRRRHPPDPRALLTHAGSAGGGTAARGARPQRTRRRADDRRRRPRRRARRVRHRRGHARGSRIPASSSCARASTRGSRWKWFRVRARRSRRWCSPGFPTDRFVFEGFLPRRGATRRERIATLGGRAAHHRAVRGAGRVRATLSDLLGRVRTAARGRGRAGAHEAVRGGVARRAGRSGRHVGATEPRRRARDRARSARRSRPRRATKRSRRTCARRWPKACRPATRPRASHATSRVPAAAGLRRRHPPASSRWSSQK